MQNSAAQHGEDLSFFLSQGLFSSGNVDTGTKLLLRTLFSHKDSGEIASRFSRASSAWDMGCGVGVIGIAVKKLFPHLNVRASDRDALACSFTRINSERNNTPLDITPGLDLLVYDAESQELKEPDDPVDIILTNIPAKAGAPVLERMCTQAICRLSSGGLFGLVIVQTLADMAESILDDLDAVLLRSEDHKDHRVLLYEKGTAGACTSETDDYPAAYERDAADFHPKSRNAAPYFLHTVFDIPGFDTVPYTAQLLAKHGERLFSLPPKQAVCIWGTGQGHTAVIISEFFRRLVKVPSALPHIVLCDRDLLALLASRKNLSLYYPRDRISLIHADDLISAWSSAEEALQLQFDGILADHTPVPMITYEKDIQFLADKLLQGAAADQQVLFAAVGKSADLAFLSKGIHSMKRILTKKYNGYRLDGFTSYSS